MGSLSGSWRSSMAPLDTDLDFEVSYILSSTTSGLADEILK